MNDKITTNLARLLKNNGFPQTGKKFIDKNESLIYFREKKDISLSGVEGICYPTLEELVSEFNKRFFSFEIHASNKSPWIVSGSNYTGTYIEKIEGITVEDALAKLWLKLI